MPPDQTWTYSQLPLLDSPEDTSPQGRSTDASIPALFKDPAFGRNKVIPIHRWVPWIAGYSAEFVRGALNSYLQGPGTVLDPFAGVGTTLVEAMLCGHNAIGFEINQYAALASQVKSSVATLPVDELLIEGKRFAEYYAERVVDPNVPHRTIPTEFRSRGAFYSPKVLHKVLILLDFIDTITSTTVRNVFKLAFASTMISYSNYSYEPSLSRRTSAGKADIDDYTVDRSILSKIWEFREDAKLVQNSACPRFGKVDVFNASFFTHASYLAPSCVDLVITSPPYLNNYHYNRNTRPHLYWLDLASGPEDLKALELSSFGKYWQTVRELPKLDLEFAISSSDLQVRLDTIRELHPEKGIYGGNGWANYAASYFNDCYKLLQGLEYCLRSGSHALIVVGNSILQGVEIQTDKYIAQIAQLTGLELLDIDIPRATRIGNSIIQSDVRVAKAKSTQQLYEAVVVLKKP